MDEEVSVLYQASSGGIRRDQIEVALSREFNRKIHSFHEPGIDVLWQEKLKENPRLFNGSKFRLHSIQEKKSKNVYIELGVTGYKDFLGTNWSKNAKEMLRLGEEEHGNKQAYMSDALGVGAFLQTKDGFVVFIRRSQHVGEAQGLWDIPGGHPEPEELVGKVNNPADICINDLNPALVVNEIFDSTLREIRDEVNVPLSSLSEPIFLGVSLNHTSAFRPSADFLVRCSLSSQEVKHLYDSGGVEAEESTSIKFVLIQDVKKLPESELWHEMAPSGKGCIVVYNQASL
ncbi:uridine diphosphate glucose pyrophosphatase NUDT22-like isoform X2 [Anneissia japonica]|uniref:uridine diphosphate glucose pyrophosphatase NUDT22-like isoform X2 n=1 Tax=Anneissia japonica TaxID=1529436 RepID=UPI001425A0D5|nr:uridine diphosphate glucose pyrophosphatase NUDT22-like isoform X2 [Anneissia japonica]